MGRADSTRHVSCITSWNMDAKMREEREKGLESYRMNTKYPALLSVELLGSSAAFI